MADTSSNTQGALAGFKSGFTWQNIGLQLANGLISGAAGWGIGMLFNELFKKENHVNLQELFQHFADDIVQRVTKNVRREIQSAMSEENMRSLNAQTIAMSENYQLYENTKEDRYIDAAEQGAIQAAAEAKTLELMALGIYQVVSGMKMSIFRERGYVQPLILEIDSATRHVRDLQEEALFGAKKGVTQSRVVRWSGKDYANRVSEDYRLEIDGEVHEVSLAPPGRDWSPISEYRNKIIDARLEAVNDGIIVPSSVILEKWEESRNQLVGVEQ